MGTLAYGSATLRLTQYTSVTVVKSGLTNTMAVLGVLGVLVTRPSSDALVTQPAAVGDRHLLGTTVVTHRLRVPLEET